MTLRMHPMRRLSALARWPAVCALCVGAVMLSQARAATSAAVSGKQAMRSVASTAVKPASPAPMPVDAQRELIDQYCMECHNFSDYAGGVEFEVFDPGAAHESAEIAERMLKKVRAGMMPPAGKPRPDFATMQAFATTLETEIDGQAKPNLHVPKLHRLNRAEYANAVRDLLSLELDSTQFLPPDDVSRGFDNQAGTLTLSPALMEAYLAAASRISRLAIGTAAAPTQVTYRVAEDTTQNYPVEGLPFGTRGGLAIDHTFPSDGKYTVKVFSVNLGNMGNFRPFGEIRGEQLLVYADGKRVSAVDWDKELGVDRRYDDEGAGQLHTIDVTLPMKAGLHRIGVTFLATNYAPGLDMNHAFERSTIETGGLPGFTFYPHIGSVRIDGPNEATEATDSPSRSRVFVCRPATTADGVQGGGVAAARGGPVASDRSAAEGSAVRDDSAARGRSVTDGTSPSSDSSRADAVNGEEACAREIATTLARRAYRGGVAPAHIDALMQFYALGRKNGSFDDGVEAIVQRVLVDPKFIYRVEATPAPVAPATAYPISDLDLASRLSFFLWSSIPDDALLDLATSSELHKPEVLREQVHRMLADPRAGALTKNFAGQWLGLRNLAGHAPVVDQFPDFDDNLRQAFRREVELLFASLLEEDRSVLDLLTADYTFLNERLARHYGIQGVRGSEFRRVTLNGSQSARWGLLGKGEFLTVSSQPGRTSPVIRGNWVLKNILGVPAPDPPPDVPTLKAGAGDAAGNSKPPSMREQMVQHRADPKCAGCHKLMDPIGFALEPFDAIGHWRTEDGGNPIDAKSEMYDGTPVDGPGDVRAFLLKYQAQYLRNVTQNLMTYALGRGIEYDDMPTVRAILHATSSSDYRLKSLIEAIALSDIFRMNVAPSAKDDGAPTQSTATATPTATPTSTPTSARVIPATHSAPASVAPTATPAKSAAPAASPPGTP